MRPLESKTGTLAFGIQLTDLGAALLPAQATVPAAEAAPATVPQNEPIDLIGELADRTPATVMQVDVAIS